MESVNTQSEIYKKSTLEVLQEINSKYPEQQEQQGSEIKEGLRALGKKLNDLIIDANPTSIHRSSKYAQYLNDVFSLEYYTEITKNQRNFLNVLEYSELIGANEVEGLFKKLTEIQNKDFLASLERKKPQINPQNSQRLDDLLEEVVNSNLGGNYYQNQAWAKLVSLFNKIDFPSMGLDDVQLVQYGSSRNNFQTKSSDIDMTLLTQCFVDERTLLNAVKEYFDEFQRDKIFEGHISKVDNNQVRIPHITIEITSGSQKFKFDLTINNILGVMNTQLIKTYASIDDRCRKLGILVKLWAKANSLDNSRECLSSYAYILMVINFLQVLEKPILPSLQKMKKEEEVIEIKRILGNHEEEIQSPDVGFERDMKIIKDKLQSFERNKSSISELLIAFFRWYIDLAKSRKEMISVKEGRLLPRKTNFRVSNESSKNTKNYVLSIEDPFDMFYDAGRNFKCLEGNELKEGNPNDYYSKFIKAMEKALGTLEEFCFGYCQSSRVNELFRS